MIRWTARHPVIPAALIGICLCLGAAAVWRMPIAYLLGEAHAPLWVDFEVPAEPGREVVLDRLVLPFAGRLLAAAGVAGHRAWIQAGWAGFEVEPTAGTDAEVVAGRLREAAAAVAGAGPDGTSSRVLRQRSEAERPGLILQLAGVGRTEIEEELLSHLHRVEGLRTVDLFPSRLPALLLAVTDSSPGSERAVQQALRWAGQRRLLGRGNGMTVVSAAPPISLPSLLELPVVHGSRSVPLAQLVRPGIRPPEHPVQYRVNGLTGLFLLVRDDPLLPRRSALAEARQVVERWVAGRDGAVVTVVLDVHREILAALGRLAAAGAIGLLLAVAALGLALRRLRATLLMAATVPLSLVLALVLLAVAGQGLDVVALGALAVAIGLLVDAAVVVGEALASRRERDPQARAVAGVGDAVRPLALGGLTTVAALAPVWVGKERAYQVMQGAMLPLVAGIAASLLVSVAIVPGLAAAIGRLPRLRRARLVARTVKHAIRDPLVTAAVVLAPAVGILLLLRPTGGVQVGQGDPRDVEIALQLPPAASAASDSRRELDLTLTQVEQRLAEVPGVQRVIAVVGEYGAWLWLRLEGRYATGGRRRETLAEVLWILGESRHRHPFRWRMSEDSRQDLGAEVTKEEATGWLGVRVRGDDAAAVERAMAQIRAVTGQPPEPAAEQRRVLLAPRLPGTDLVSCLAPTFDRRPVELMIDGEARQLEVRARGEPAARKPAPLSVWLSTPSASGVPPIQLAHHRLVREPLWPPFEDGAFVGSARLRVSDQAATLVQLEAKRARLHRLLRQLPLPPGVSLSVDELQVRQPLPPWLLPASLALVCLLLVLGIGFESLLAPLRVMVVVVPHLAGSGLLLWLLQVRVNEAAVLGALLLLGVAVNAGVLLEDRYLGLRRCGTRHAAAVARAGIERGSTVLLTAATSVLALAPLWLAGVDQLGRPFVAVLGGGLLVGTPATLLLLPALQAIGVPRPQRRQIRWRGDGSDVVQLRSLSKRYGTVQALRDVTARLEPGMVGLLGPNGAGKTTLLRCMVGALRADTGDLWVNGVPRREDAVGWRALVGYLPQSQQVPLSLTAGLWLELWAGELQLPDPSAAVAEAMSSLGVEDLAGQRLGELSGGQRRRVRIARALLGRPTILVVDEPTTGLDPEARVDLRNLLATLARDRLVLLSTHIPEDIAVACNRVLVLCRGSLRFDGTVEELRRQAAGSVYRHLVPDQELPAILQEHRIVSRVRELEGIRLRYLSDRSDTPGEQVDPTLEEAYLWLLRDQQR